MPLLKGKLDPERFNSATLAALFGNELRRELDAGITVNLLDVAQAVIERLAQLKIVE
jgi:hypothetical protein